MRQNRSRMPPVRVVAGYVLIVLLWGSTWAAIKVGVSSVPPFVFAFERAVTVSLLLTGLSMSVAQFETFLNAKNSQGFLAAAFAGADIITGSDKADNMHGFVGNDTIAPVVTVTVVDFDTADEDVEIRSTPSAAGSRPAAAGPRAGASHRARPPSGRRPPRARAAA